MTQTRAIALTVVLRRAEQGAGFTGVIAELPGTYAEGESLPAVREALTDQIRVFFDGNRAVGLLGTSDNAMTETIAVAMLAFPDADDREVFALSFDVSRSVRESHDVPRILRGVPVEDIVQIERLLKFNREYRAKT